MSKEKNLNLREEEFATDDENSPLVVIASNRGPFSFSKGEDGTFFAQRGSGGLVTALGALAEKLNVLWVASALSRDDYLWSLQQEQAVVNVEGIDLTLISSGEEEYDQYYNVISNPLLWFIQHQLWDSPRTPSITKEVWDAWQDGYVNVNKRFADRIADVAHDTSRPIVVFPQDYHLYMLPHFLRERLGYSIQIQPFVHIPWPGPDAWRMLPEQMRSALLLSLLSSDRIGFQTRQDAFNFVQSCRVYLSDAHSFGRRDAIFYHDREISAKAYPISIDVEKVEALALDRDTVELRRQIKRFAGDRQLILRTDRVEPSKNILRGLEAYESLLELYPEHQDNVQMLALLVPSRTQVTEYQDYLNEIMAKVGFINAHYGDGVWEPVRLMLGDNYPRAIAAMQLYDVLLVNPIADGMNLVAKEGALVNANNGVLVLSEHAGAYYELGEHALSVSPYDVYGTARVLHRALVMSQEERKQRADALRERVRVADVKHWFRNQMEDALRALHNQPKSSSTPDTSLAIKSADSTTSGGADGDSTPTPKA